LRKNEAEKIQFIENCPECGSRLVRNAGEAAHYCPNSKACPPQIKGKIIHFISRKAMNIDSLGEETIELFYQQGLVKSVADLYTLNREKLLPLERMADKSVNNILTNLESSKSAPFERVLFALGIRHVGATVAKNLARAFGSMQKLREASLEALTDVEEIGEKIAESVREYFSDPENLELIDFLQQQGLNFEASAKAAESDLLKGLQIIASGKLQKYSREEIKQVIEAHGGKAVSSISKQTSYLLAGENIGPNKLKKALDLGIPVISEEDFDKMLAR
jgi:DNA ligase (NAD+)